jgi:hypothetical protein
VKRPVDLVAHGLGGARRIETAVERASDDLPASFLDPQYEGGELQPRPIRTRDDQACRLVLRLVGADRPGTRGDIARRLFGQAKAGEQHSNYQGSDRESRSRRSRHSPSTSVFAEVELALHDEPTGLVVVSIRDRQPPTINDPTDWILLRNGCHGTVLSASSSRSSVSAAS